MNERWWERVDAAEPPAGCVKVPISTLYLGERFEFAGTGWTRCEPPEKVRAHFPHARSDDGAIPASFTPSMLVTRRITVRDKLRELGFEELRAVYHRLTGKETTVGLAANTDETRAAAFRRLVVKLDRLLRKAADEQGLPVDELLASYLPHDVTVSVEGQVVATGKVHVATKGAKIALDLEPEPKPVNGLKGLVRPCAQCGATGLHKCCKRCGISATGEKEVKQAFGFRKLTNKRTGEQTTRPQPWCRDCRSEAALEGQRAARAKAKAIALENAESHTSA